MRFVTDWVQRVDFSRLRRFRLGRVRAAMDDHDLDAIIAFEYANGRYIASLRPLWAPNFLVRQAVVVTRYSDEIICFIHLDDTPHRRTVMDWIPDENIREFPTGVVNESSDPEALGPLADALRQLGFTGGRLGVDIGTVSSLRNIEGLFDPVELVDANACMQAARMVKNEDELELMRWASGVVDLALDVATDTVAIGRRECEVLAEVMRVFYNHGAEVPQCNLIVCSGPNTAPMQRFAGDRLIREGDLVFMDIGACFNGVFSEATRTVVCGTPNEQQRELFQTVHQIHLDTIASLVPGAHFEDVQTAANEHYAGSKFHGNMQKMVIAHGIGVGYAEPPFIAPPGRPARDMRLEPGMTLAVVPTILVPGIPGGGGVRLEDIVAVTEAGPELLTRAPYDEKLLA